jgi:putative radical SAM enzyme (TIGR03279 family)
MQGAEIVFVEEGSLAEELGLTVGDRLCKINNKEIEDLITYQIEWAEEQILLEVCKRNGEHVIYEIEKDYDEPLGAHFQRAVFNGLRTCRNKCVFCFVDQMPPKMRASLYQKDDDYRLSFLQGSYVTLTNLSQEDLDRIKREHLSPLYVSVHTTDAALRTRLLKNPQAGNVLEIMQELSEAGIEFHTQVVACPGLNDGEALRKTYEDLRKMNGVLSLAVVPVGLTGFRQGLPQLRVFRQEEAACLVDWVEQKQELELRQRGSRFLWPSDEFYLLSGRDFPEYESYEDFAQLENGVGMVRLLWEEFSRLALPAELDKPREIVFATGLSGVPVLKPLVERLNKIKGLRVTLQAVPNTFFGSTITVSGLLTGSCFLAGLKNLAPGTIVFIPDTTVKSGDGKFLDDLTPADVGEALGIKLYTVPIEAQEIWRMISNLKGGL